jgi:hypothetical protein
VKIPKKLLWLGGLIAFVIAAQIGSTPRRSDDLRVALMSQCPVSKGSLESGGVAVEIAAAIADAATGAAVTTAAQIAKAYGQAHASTPRTGATAEHFHLLNGRGELLVNKQIWNCLVITVKDLRAADAAAADGASDPYAQDRVFLEARIVYAADGSAFELQPVTLRFRGSAEPSLLGSAARDLQFEITFSAPGAKEPFARTVLDFQSLVPSTGVQWSVDRLGTAGRKLARRASERGAGSQGRRRTAPYHRAQPDHGEGIVGRKARRERVMEVSWRAARLALVVSSDAKYIDREPPPPEPSRYLNLCSGRCLALESGRTPVSQLRDGQRALPVPGGGSATAED